MSLKPEVKEMAAKIKESLAVDGTAITEKEDSRVYETTLPEGLSIKTVKQVSEHNTTFVAGAALAIGELAVDALVDNKDADRIEGRVKMNGTDSIKINVDRSKSFSGHLTNGKETVKHGVISSNYEIKAGKNSGQLKATRLAINELAMEKLA